MKRVFAVAAVAAALFAGGAAAQEKWAIVNGDLSGEFTVTKNGNTLVGDAGKNVSAAKAVETIKNNAMGGAVAIQLGDSTKALDMGSGALSFHYDNSEEGQKINFPKIKLTGGIKSTAIALRFSGNPIGVPVDVELEADIEGGTYVSSGCNVLITGGNVKRSGEGYEYGFEINGSAMKITGGNFSATGSINLISSYNSDLTITGGKFESKGEILLLVYGGKAAISGTAEFKSDTAAAKVIEINGTAAVAINGAKVTNTAAGGVAVRVGSAQGSLSLGGTPEITGAIYTGYANRIAVDSTFKPGANKYKLLLTGGILDNGSIVVRGGGAHLSSFEYSHQQYSLAAANGNIVLRLPANFTAPSYVITGSVDGGFLAKRTGKDTVGLGNIRSVIDSIRVDAKALPCSVQFGGGAQFLDVGRNTVSFNGDHGEGWGKITLLGKLSGASTNGRSGPEAVIEAHDVTIDNAADINDTNGVCTIALRNNANFTHKAGTIAGGIYPLGAEIGTSLTVVGGKVEYINNAYTERVITTISGGTVGDSALARSAIINASASGELYITGGTVISADTGGGTIVNGGFLAISGGKAVNAGKGQNRTAVLNGLNNTDTTANTVISGKAEVYSSNKSGNNSESQGVVDNRRGVMTISGGKIYSLADTAAALIMNQGSAKMTISDSADITFDGNRLSRGAVWNRSVLSGADSASMSMTITGGKISAKGGYAVEIGLSKTSVSGTAEITSSLHNGAVYAGNRAELYLLGGKVSSGHDTLEAVRVLAEGRSGAPAKLIMGGSPTLTGSIRYYDEAAAYSIGEPITVLAAGATAFSPGAKKYNLLVAANNNGVVLKNGARFVSNFALDTVVPGNDSLKLAANGNDAVATKGRTREIKFNIMGGIGTPPASIFVVNESTLGSLAKPATDGYVIVRNGLSYRNDGEWHIANGQTAAGEWSYSGNVFKFGTGNDGTDVGSDMTLLLKWTDSVVVSVQKSDREIPAAPAVDVAAIAPIVITAGEFTAGPNPSAKRSGKVSFFWNGAALKGGTLALYDAAGNVVGKAAVSDKSGAAGKRPVAAWNLKDAKGRLVADGVYAVKGVVNTKAGKAEKVSMLIGVR